MQKIVRFLPLLLAFNSFSCQGRSNNSHSASPELADSSALAIEHTGIESKAEAVVVGAARLNEYLPLLTNRKIALMVNQTSVVDTTHLVDLLLDKGVEIVRIFAPEHGFRGDHSAGAHVDNSKDAQTGLPIVSLYGKYRKPTKEMLAGVDLILFDIQDVGVRFYTYISSMHYLMEACADNGVDFMVLDRPNPNGHYVDGPTLEPEFRSFIGMHTVPLVHGMTTGEFAQMIVGEKWLESTKELRYKVIPCLNYTHHTYYQLPIRPSPNLPNMNSVYLYPSLGLFEGTNVSVGRGTDFPFQVLARPDEKEGNIEFTPVVIPGVADDPKHLGKRCKGIDLRNEYAGPEPKNDAIRLEWLQQFYTSNREDVQGPFFKSTFAKLAGTRKLQEQIEQKWSEAQIRETWSADLEKFREMRKPYLLYPN
ncbi:MAG: DUF1343 domain-containing protein [Flavobacteriales bacterium]|nr:DUF1343 domain-containing protein [Flavobacteriales bacterium]